LLRTIGENPVFAACGLAAASARRAATSSRRRETWWTLTASWHHVPAGSEYPWHPQL